MTWSTSRRTGRPQTQQGSTASQIPARPDPSRTSVITPSSGRVRRELSSGDRQRSDRQHERSTRSRRVHSCRRLPQTASMPTQQSRLDCCLRRESKFELGLGRARRSVFFSPNSLRLRVAVHPRRHVEERFPSPGLTVACCERRCPTAPAALGRDHRPEASCQSTARGRACPDTAAGLPAAGVAVSRQSDVAGMAAGGAGPRPLTRRHQGTLLGAVGSRLVRGSRGPSRWRTDSAGQTWGYGLDDAAASRVRARLCLTGARADRPEMGLD